MIGALPAGVVFDCDGTLADTESIAQQAWSVTLAERGYVPTEDDFRALIGHPYPQNWAYFDRFLDLGDPELFRRQIRDRYVTLFEEDVEVHPDSVGTLRALAESGVRIGVASSSTRAGVFLVLDRAGISDLVEVVVGSEDVAEHKPAPEPYLRAAAALGLEAEACSAVEDTPVGVASARAAGMFTVAVLRAHGDPTALADAHRIVAEVTLESVVHGTWGRSGSRNGRS